MNNWSIRKLASIDHDHGWPPAPPLLLLQGEVDRPVYCITKSGWKGGWRYLNEWAAMTAFQSWDGAGAPPAGTWMDL